MGGDGGAVLGRRVAHVRVELPARMALGGAMHVAVTGALRDDRGSRDGGAPAVTVHDGALLEAEVPHPETVHEADRTVAGDREQSRAEGVQVRDVQAAGVDAAYAARDHGDLRRGPEHLRVEL